MRFIFHIRYNKVCDTCVICNDDEKGKYQGERADINLHNVWLVSDEVKGF